MAAVFLHLGRFLEPRGGRGVWFSHKPAHHTLLYPGDQHHPDTRAYRVVRGVWPPGDCAHAFLGAAHIQKGRMVRFSSQMVFLGPEWRHISDDGYKPDTLGILPVLPCGEQGHVVCAEP